MDQLRGAADAVRTADTHQDLAEALSHLAGAMQTIGLQRWPGFLSDSAVRAAAYRPQVVAAQAAQPAPAAPTPARAAPAPVVAAPHPAAAVAGPGAYVAADPRSWIGPNSVGTGECVALVRAATGAPHTSEWRQGVAVAGAANIRVGTAIATFDSAGHYSGHAAIYLGQDANGIQVIDQWNRGQAGGVADQHHPSQRTLPLGQP